MTGGKASRRKGDKFERECVALFQEHGIAAERVPLSGAAGGSFSGDITIPVLGADQRLEAKIRRSGFKQIQDWIAGNDAVVFRADRRESLITIRLRVFAELAIAADKKRGVA